MPTQIHQLYTYLVWLWGVPGAFPKCLYTSLPLRGPKKYKIKTFRLKADTTVIQCQCQSISISNSIHKCLPTLCIFEWKYKILKLYLFKFQITRIRKVILRMKSENKYKMTSIQILNSLVFTCEETINSLFNWETLLNQALKKLQYPSDQFIRHNVCWSGD